MKRATLALGVCAVALLATTAHGAGRDQYRPRLLWSGDQRPSSVCGAFLRFMQAVWRVPGLREERDFTETSGLGPVVWPRVAPAGTLPRLLRQAGLAVPQYSQQWQCSTDNPRSGGRAVTVRLSPSGEERIAVIKDAGEGNYYRTDVYLLQKEKKCREDIDLSEVALLIPSSIGEIHFLLPDEPWVAMMPDRHISYAGPILPSHEILDRLKLLFSNSSQAAIQFGEDIYFIRNYPPAGSGALLYRFASGPKMQIMCVFSDTPRQIARRTPHRTTQNPLPAPAPQ